MRCVKLFLFTRKRFLWKKDVSVSVFGVSLRGFTKGMEVERVGFVYKDHLPRGLGKYMSAALLRKEGQQYPLLHIPVLWMGQEELWKNATGWLRLGWICERLHKWTGGIQGDVQDEEGSVDSLVHLYRQGRHHFIIQHVSAVFEAPVYRRWWPPPGTVAFA